ncbi:MAG: hypothetical protein WBG37_18635 [Desulfobacterales bacterium]
MAATQTNACCSMEKSRLVEQLRKCDMCTDNYEEFHQCYRDAARESGQRARTAS